MKTAAEKIEPNCKQFEGEPHYDRLALFGALVRRSERALTRVLGCLTCLT